MLKLNASYSKKVPAEGEYSSQSYHASIEVELPDGLTSEQLNGKIHETFEMVKNSVESELHGKDAPKQAGYPIQKPAQNGSQGYPSQHPQNSREVPASPKQITNHLEESEFYFVFNEFWLSVLLMKCKEGMSYNISYDALMSSRSKKYFSELLKKHGILSIERRYLQRGECVQSGSIVRPDSGYSGRGVKFFFNNTNFTDAFAAVSKDCSVNMKKILMHENIDLVVEPYIDGEEYSCDVIISPFGIQIVRLCLKYITWIDGCPCTICLPYADTDRNNEKKHKGMVRCDF